MAEVFHATEARIAALLARSERILLQETVTDAERAIADSCRETAKELRLAAVFAKGTAHRQEAVAEERQRAEPATRRGRAKANTRALDDEDIDV